MTRLSTIQAMPVRVRRLIAINTINAAGSGLVVPLLVVYLHEMRGLPLSVATGVVAITSIGALAGAPLTGWLADRVGRAPSLWLALTCSALGEIGLAFCTTTATALAAGLMQGLGLGGAIVWNALIAEIVPDQFWPVLFSVDFALVNAMMGLGGLAGGLIAGLTDSVLAFQILYVVDGLTFLVTGLLVVREVRRGREDSRPDAPATDSARNTPAESQGYGDVFRNHSLLALLAAVLVLFTLGYSQLNSGMPAVLLAESRLGATELGLMFAANTAAVVVIQFALLNRLKHLSPRVALALLGAAWAAFWLLILALLGIGNEVVAVLIGLLAMVVFAVGESLLAATGPTLVNTWATDANRGRFNAAYGFMCSLGFTIGPLMSGPLAEGGHSVVMVVAFAAGLAILAIVAATSRFLPRTPLEGLENGETSDTTVLTPTDMSRLGEGATP